MYLQDSRSTVDARDRRNVANEIEAEIVVECHVPRVIRTNHEERISIGRCLHYRLNGEIAASAGPVLDDDWLTEALGQPLTDQAGKRIDHATWGKAGDQSHRTRWVGLRPCGRRHGQQRGSAPRQMQKSTAAKFHDALPERLCVAG